jgi:Bac_Flav_CT_G: Bacteroides conjugation system ATPase, TraG family
LLGKRFIVFEIDQIKDHPILFPVTTIIIMDLFINKMRRLKGVRKMIIIEEAWKAIAREGMAELYPLPVQDCPQILRRGGCGDAGSR